MYFYTYLFQRLFKNKLYLWQTYPVNVPDFMFLVTNIVATVAFVRFD